MQVHTQGSFFLKMFFQWGSFYLVNTEAFLYFDFLWMKLTDLQFPPDLNSYLVVCWCRLFDSLFSSPTDSDWLSLWTIFGDGQSVPYCLRAGCDGFCHHSGTNRSFPFVFVFIFWIDLYHFPTATSGYAESNCTALICFSFTSFTAPSWAELCPR